MKNKKNIILSIIVFFAILLFSNVCMAKDLDVINDYSITVDPRSDGSLDITYHIEWEVLDSTTEGPLSWVQIGIPNSHVDSIKALSDNIRSIKYDSTGGDFVRIDFIKMYNAGDIVKFDFSLHQSYMYTISGNKCIYNFTPGWFSSIKVKNINVYWNADKVLSGTTKQQNSDNYLVWSDNLGKNDKLKTQVTYDVTAFRLDSNKQYVENTYSTNSTNSSEEIVASIICFIIIFAFLYALLSKNGYRSHSGYGYRHSSRHYGHRHHGYGYSHRSTPPRRSSYSSSSYRSSCVSSCACACACAGGGRAGCSKKDLYGTNLTTKNIAKALNKK